MNRLSGLASNGRDEKQRVDKFYDWYLQEH